MKLVKALNQGIVSDLGLGSHQYSITMEGTEVEDSIAAKLKDIFGHLVEVTDVTVSAPVDVATEPEPVVEPEVVPEAPVEVPVEVPSDVVPEAPVEETPIEPTPAEEVAIEPEV